MIGEIVSVIIPVYNSAGFINRCVGSVLQQTYPALEVMLVDDGSTDGSGLLCDKWAEKDPRIHVIHKENGGLSDARNAGLDKASGDYLAFVDSDDIIAPDMVQSLYNAMKEADAPLGICNFLYVDEEGVPLPERNDGLPVRDEILAGREIIEKSLIGEKKGWYYIPAWNKLYHRSLFSKLRFPIGKLHEDEFIVHHMLGACQRVACVRKAGYYYVQRPGSIMHSKSAESNLHAAEAYLDRAVYCEAQGLSLCAGRAYRKAAIYLSDSFSGSAFTSAQEKERKEMLLAFRSSRRLQITCSLKEKLQIAMISANPRLYRFLFRNSLRQRWKASRGSRGKKT